MTDKLRFLFVMQYPGYLRYFDSTVRLLAARGHHVDITFDTPRKQAEGAEALEGLAGSVDVLGQTPAREGPWATVAGAVRGTIDYVRYLHPMFADAPYLRDRMRKTLPPVFAFFAKWDTASRAATQALVRTLTTMERAIPSSWIIELFIGSRQPDAVLVTPLVTDRCPQVDLIKGAQALGIPAALCVASWDHLTTKGLIRVEPDLVSVWNDEQKKEAIEFHGTPPGSITVTGAQPFDRWFERIPTDRVAFCHKVGLPPERPFVLFAGSTASISSPDAELLFVRRWIEALRREPDLARVSVLVRPHPYNSRHWSDVDFADLPGVVVYPRTANPVNEADRQDYFDSLHHSEAVVGVNTTAMVEAAIVGRTVHSVLADEFKDTQSGTLHFRYLLAENGGFLRVAPDLTAHARQLVETLRSPEMGRDACARFVATFIRPHGIGVASTPILVDALERLARSGRRPVRRVPLLLYPLSALVWSVGVVDLMRHPDVFRRTVLKQFKIVRKRFRNAQKRRRRKAAEPVRLDADRSEIPRRKVG
jgi:hypothetical protein